MTKVKNVEVKEMMKILEFLISKNTQYVNIVIENENSLYFEPSLLISEHEVMGNNIINTINFEEDEQEEV